MLCNLSPWARFFRAITRPAHAVLAERRPIVANTSEENMTLFPESADDLLICSPSGRILFQSSNLRARLQLDLVGRSLNDVLPDSQAAALIVAAHEGRPHGFQSQLCGQPVRCAMEPWDDKLMITVFPAEQTVGPTLSLRAAELLSREISSSLGTMFAALDALPPPQDAHGQLAWDAISQGLYRLTRLSRNLLDCARAENGQLELQIRAHDLADLCRRIQARLEPILAQLAIPLACEIPPGPLSCQYDEEKLERVLYNLFCNSIKYTRPGNAIRFSLAVKGENAVLQVSDRGAGIPQDMIPYMFCKHKNPAAASRPLVSGAGYGFALARAILSLHGGTCFATSQQGQGTIVKLTLPLRQPEGPQATLSSPQLDYASGFDHLLLELSPALPSHFFARGTKPAED